MRGRDVNSQSTTISLTEKELRSMNHLEQPSPRAHSGLIAIVVACAVMLTAAIGAPPAMAEFGLNNFDVTFSNEDGTPATQAGSHPFAVDTRFQVNNHEVAPFEWEADGELQEAFFQQAAGLIGDPTAVGKCPTADFVTSSGPFTGCPADTQIGLVAASFFLPDAWGAFPVFALPPAPGVPARFGFVIFGVVKVIVNVGVKQEADYNLIGSLRNQPQIVPVYGARLQLWGNPADPAHDRFRGSSAVSGACSFGVQLENFGFEMDVNEVEFLPKETPCPSGVEDPRPFLTLPSSCTGPVVSSYKAKSWQEPGVWGDEGSALSHDFAEPPSPQGFTGCGKLGFAPRVEAEATSDSAETGTGLDFNVDFHDEGLTQLTGLAQSQTKKAVVTLPEGVTVNPSVGEGLGVCTPADLARETIDSTPGQGCPNSSKIGTLHLETPLVEEAVDGSVFLAQQDDPSTTTPGAENPFDSLIAIYLVLKNQNLGVSVKLPAKVEPDPVTGQLVTTLEDIPQIPFSHFNFHFREGQRAPLVTPNACGTYTTEAKFYPWSDPTNPRTVTSSFEITEGVGSGPCPSGGVPPFNPSFEAGAMNNNAGSFSPFNMRLIRNDGEQDMTKFSSILPPGQLGSLAGVGKCPDAAVGLAKSKTGRQEQASPSCPASSEIGRTLAGAGVGGALTYVPGKIYLGGPYKGAPLSVISITPAVAGPFDAGTVAVRLGLDLNPKTAEVEVDGAASDPIPHILKGIVLKLRDLRVYVDRPNFTLNSTSCDESSTKATLFGSYLDVFNPADDVPVSRDSRFQAANCASLGFKPKLSINLKGGAKRGKFPALRAVLRPRPGDANLKRTVVRLPRSAFLEQGHIRTICTRVQWAADACPKGSVYGKVAAHTPLLDEPLRGNAYLRSSNNELPDLVFDLKGIVDIEAAARIDSVRGGIRAIFPFVPDAPLSRVVVEMQGGKKGLIVNSRNLCAGPSRASVKLDGHNGKAGDSRPLVRADCGKRRKQR